MNLPMLPQDKANHFVYGAVIYMFAVLLLLSPLQALALVAVVGFGKEAADAFVNWRTTGNPMQGPHGVEAGDVLATFLGGLTCAFAILGAAHG